MRPRLLLSLPAVAAAIVAWAVLGRGVGRVRYVQILGGPTREGPTLSLLVRALELDDERRVPLPDLALQLEARAGATSARANGTTDAGGELEVRLDFPAPPASDPRLRVEGSGSGAHEVLAEGELSLDVERWREGARRDGGWLPGQTRGELRVRVAAESGAFAVPFTGQLLLQVLAPRAGADGVTKDDAGLPVAAALVRVELDGGELVADVTDSATLPPATLPPATLPPAQPTRLTDGAGLARLGFRPLEHAVSARVRVSAGAREGEWYGALPVIPGALLASYTSGAIEVRSPIARERAFLSLVSARERIAGAIVPLAVDVDGGASGRFALDPALRARLDAEPVWAVISSEYDKRSSGAMGWPLRPGFDPRAPRLAFSVPDRVLLDGLNGALYDVQQRQRARRQSAAAGLLGVGALMGAAFWLELRGTRRREKRGGATLTERRQNGPVPIGDRPENADELPLLSSGGWRLGVALACVALGLGALAYFGLLTR